MFLDVWKEKRIKRNLDKAIRNYTGATPTSAINRVGLLIDATEAVDVDKLSGLLDSYKRRMNITKLCYVARVDNKKFYNHSTFDDQALNWKGDFNNAEVDFFLNQPYDMLISYYTSSNLILRFLTASAKAHLKVGLATGDDHRLNDLIIATQPDEESLFCEELKTYLKILKRID